MQNKCLKKLRTKRYRGQQWRRFGIAVAVLVITHNAKVKKLRQARSVLVSLPSR